MVTRQGRLVLIVGYCASCLGCATSPQVKEPPGDLQATTESVPARQSGVVPPWVFLHLSCDDTDCFATVPGEVKRATGSLGRPLPRCGGDAYFLPDREQSNPPDLKSLVQQIDVAAQGSGVLTVRDSREEGQLEVWRSYWGYRVVLNAPARPGVPLAFALRKNSTAKWEAFDYGTNGRA
jgi:hypothetical protein